VHFENLQQAARVVHRGRQGQQPHAKASGCEPRPAISGFSQGLSLRAVTLKASATESAEQAHERSARMKFSDKCKQLRNLLNNGKIPNSENAKELLSQIEGCERNIFVHSFLASDEHSVTFIHRKVEQGRYQPTGYTIPREGFIDHVQDFVQLSFDFEQAVGLTDKEVRDFGAMALPLADLPG
jgi:hypothetical protein